MIPEYLVSLIAIIALVMATVALRAANKARAHSEATRRKFDPESNRLEKIAYFRGQIQACKAVEATVDESEGMPALMLLALRRGEAAQAREQLRAMGIEV